jgi:hemolysin D
MSILIGERNESVANAAEYIVAMQLRTADAHFVVDSEPRPVVSGMTVQADITTDRRRVIDFFLSSVVKYLDEGMKVR